MSKKSQQNRPNFLDNVEKINAEFLTLTYGSLMVRLIKDYENQKK